MYVNWVLTLKKPCIERWKKTKQASIDKYRSEMQKNLAHYSLDDRIKEHSNVFWI